MDTLEILDELLKKSSDEIDYAILLLMTRKKIDSHHLFDLYMKSLEIENEDKYDKLIESQTTVLELLENLSVPKSKRASTVEHIHNVIHRALYGLNTLTRTFCMHSLNEKYGYDEESDRHLSCYWRNKNNE